MNIAQKLEHVARCAHEANRHYCRSIGDNSQLPWDKAPAIIKESVLSGVKNMAKNPDMTPAQSHQAWLDYKTAEGWKYGETKDVEAKIHPCMVPYDELPPAQRAKDAIFTSVVRGLLFVEGLCDE